MRQLSIISHDQSLQAAVANPNSAGTSPTTDISPINPSLASFEMQHNSGDASGGGGGGGNTSVYSHHTSDVTSFSHR